MKNILQINQSAIIKNNFNIKGTTLDTWALFDFLAMCATNHDKLKKDGEWWFWVNFNYLQYALPLCKFNEKRLKKHLDLLEKIGLIELSNGDRDDNKDDLFYRLGGELLYDRRSKGYEI